MESRNERPLAIAGGLFVGQKVSGRVKMSEGVKE
jgi:hypothetical protein